MTESRNYSGSSKPVWRYQIDQQSWASGESSAATVNFPVCGIVYSFVTVINNNTNNRTATVSIQDEDSYALYTSGNIAEDATTTTRLTAGTEIYVPPGCNVVITPSGDPGTSGMTVTVTFYGI